MSGMTAPAPPASGINDIHYWVKFVGDPAGYAAKLDEFQAIKTAAEEASASASTERRAANDARDALATERAAFLDLKNETDHEHSVALTAIADRGAAVKAREEAVALREEAVTARITKFESDNKDTNLQLDTRQKEVDDAEEDLALRKSDLERMRKQLQAKLDAIAAIYQAGQ